MAREGILFGLGNPLLDISANVDEEYLKKYDLKANDAILAEDKHIPIYKEISEKYEAEYIPGGATQNAIKIAQWHLGTPDATTFMGCIGKDDEFGKILETNTRKLGVNTIYQYDEKTPTGTAACLVTGNNRSLIANLAAANCFSKDHIDDEKNWAVIEKADFFYIAGFPLTVCPPAILKVAKHACEKKKTFMMNLSAPFICQFFKEPLMECMPYVDVLFGNETEAATFAEQQGFETKDVKEIALKTAALAKENSDKPRIVVFTQGAEPTIVVKDGKVTEYPIIKLDEKDIVDTNGAGDAFVGGFLAQLVKGNSIEECIRCGNYTANLIIQRSGCTFPEKPDFH